MRCVCKYDPVRDIRAVSQTGYVDLAKANALSSVPASISAEQLSFNEIDDPRSIAGRPSDVFEAAQAAKVIAGYKAPAKPSESE